MKELDKGYEFTKAQISELESLRARIAELEKQEPVAWMQISVEDGVDTKFPRMERPTKFNSDWWKFEPLFAAPVVSPDVEKLRAEIAELKSHNKRIMDMYVEYSDENRSLKAELEAARKDAVEAGKKCDGLVVALKRTLRWVDEMCQTGPEFGFEEIEKQANAAIEQAKGAAE